MPKGKTIEYSELEQQFLIENHTLPRKELTELFNKQFNRNLTENHIKRKCLRMGYRTGRTGCFAKGHIPFNKGTKGVSQSNITSFKKGHTPANHRPVGSLRYNKRDNSFLVKIAEPNKWEYRAKVVWMQHHKAIPEGYSVWHINGDSTDDRIENLALRSKLEILQLNQLNHKQQPTELKEAVDLIARIKAKKIVLTNPSHR